VFVQVLEFAQSKELYIVGVRVDGVQFNSIKICGCILKFVVALCKGREKKEKAFVLRFHQVQGGVCLYGVSKGEYLLYNNRFSDSEQNLHFK
jgi:hypothetical protein